MEPPVNTTPPETRCRAQHEDRRNDDQAGGFHVTTLARAKARRDVTYDAD